jgi:glutamate-ammonia-ligase adenylyltransferase
LLDHDEQTKELWRDLPDAEGARRFHEQLAREHPRAARRLDADPGLLSDALALAAWSPLLATTLAQQPDYLQWLARERMDRHVRSTEELQESLARFALTHSSESPHVVLARFRRRELLRIYLHDIRRTATIVETTEELSNLADAVLAYALNLARQELDNLYGSPLARDERGRKTQATFCVVALGKLGSRELNYSSDIDLLFLYSEDGETSGAGSRAATTNREYFNRLAERIARITGEQRGEGAAYRVDLRLRPHGRDGALAVSLAESSRYYRETAQAWELQTLLRARASAGSNELFARFYEEVWPRVYSHARTATDALSNVRLAKQKIDRQHGTEARGFNVKLGRGGIREIEFIAQALQLAHGARDTWLHAPHTLISLGRLADRQHITERERTELSDAYTFLRALEHRLQMEEGLQTHAVPEARERRKLVARRMNFKGDDALVNFDRALALHTSHVRAAFDRVFTASDDELRDKHTSHEVTTRDATLHDTETATRSNSKSQDVEAAGTQIGAAHDENDPQSRPPNERRAQLFLARVRAAVEKSEPRVELTGERLASVERLCGASEYFGEMIAGNPELIDALVPDKRSDARDYRATLRAAVDRERSFRDELKALRRAWSRLLVEIGAKDAAGEIALAASNRAQTDLAVASVNIALLVARRELVRRYGSFAAGPRLAVLALGRLASAGMDYGSDLDIIAVHDPRVVAPLSTLAREESYTRLVELMTTALSSLTREGHLYRVDLRLRPDGRNGALSVGADAFIEYVRARTQVWEWLAYVKLRAVAGDLEFGRAVEQKARRAIHEAARKFDAEELRRETRRVRERLERERATRAGREIDIKFGAGGMLDVYFAARYLQLRDGVRDEGEDRSTLATLTRLRERGSLDAETHDALGEGYAALRALDHALRLVAGRSARVPAAADHPLVADLARTLGFKSPSALLETLRARMTLVRAAYERVTG